LALVENVDLLPWTLTALGTVISTLCAVIAIQYKNANKRQDVEIVSRDKAIESKDKRYDELIVWTRYHSEKSVENYARIINILDKMSDANQTIEDSIAREMSLQIRDLKLEISSEFNDIKLILKEDRS